VEWFLTLVFQILNLIHNRISYPNVEKEGDTYDISNSLCQLLNDDLYDRIISLLIQYQHHNDRRILKNPSLGFFSHLSLCRIFVSSNQTFSFSSLEQFLIGCMKFTKNSLILSQLI